MERLRHVARGSHGSDEELLLDAAGALMACAEDPAGLLTACRRIVARIPGSAPIVQLCARMIMAPDAAAEARAVVRASRQDRTFRELAALVPAESRVVVLGASRAMARGMATRGDLELFVVDSGDSRLFTELLNLDMDVVDVPPAGIGPAMEVADRGVVEAVAWGPSRWLGPPGSHALAAVARSLDKPVWVTVGAGRVLPSRMFEPMAEAAIQYDPWDAEVESIPIGLVDVVVGPDGEAMPETTIRRADCPIAPEIFGGRV